MWSQRFTKGSDPTHSHPERRGASDGYGGTHEDVSKFLFTIGDPSSSGIVDNNMTTLFIGTGLNAAMIAIAVVVLLKKSRSN